ncbi:MAG TPA: APC family permease [Rhizomicrobium sp.]|nr:APC family permease [Rhizomicrobium sp.]
MSVVENIAGSERGHLLKILGVTFGVAVAVGDMIGSGILRAPNAIAATVPSIALIMGLWCLGALNAALNGNVLAELGTAIPKSGGVYNYAERAFGDIGGLIIGWANWLAFVAGTGAAAISFANFLPLIWPWAAQHTIGVAVAMLLALFGANILGLREGRALQEGTSLVKASMLAVFCVAAVLFAPQSQPLPPAVAAAPVLGWGAMIAAYQLVRGAYAGWDTPFYFGEEVVDAGRALPRAMYIGMALTAVLYLGVNGALLYALGLNGVASSPLPFTIVLAQFGPVAKVLFALTAMITVASCANANIMGGPRIIFSLARDGLLPHWFTIVNKGGTPTVALLLTALFSVGLAISGEFERVFALIGTLNGVGAIAMAVALFVLRRREPELARPYRARLYPVLPALSLIIEVVFMVLYSWTDTVGILFAIGLAIACIPFALIARHGKIRT